MNNKNQFFICVAIISVLLIVKYVFDNKEERRESNKSIIYFLFEKCLLFFKEVMKFIKTEFLFLLILILFSYTICEWISFFCDEEIQKKVSDFLNTDYIGTIILAFIAIQLALLPTLSEMIIDINNLYSKGNDTIRSRNLSNSIKHLQYNFAYSLFLLIINILALIISSSELLSFIRVFTLTILIHSIYDLSTPFFAYLKYKVK